MADISEWTDNQLDAMVLALLSVLFERKAKKMKEGLARRDDIKTYTLHNGPSFQIRKTGET